MQCQTEYHLLVQTLERAVTPKAPIVEYLHRGLSSQIEGGNVVILHSLLERVPDINAILDVSRVPSHGK